MQTVGKTHKSGCRAPYAAVDVRRPSFPGCRLASLEQSATSRHVCTVNACFLQSSEDSSLQPQFSLTTCTCRRLLPMLPTCRLDVDSARRPPTNCWCRPTGGPRSEGGRSRSLALVSGTIFHLTLRLLRRWPSLDGAWTWRQNFFAAATMLPDCSLLL